MPVVRQQHELTCADVNGLAAVDAQLHAPLGDEVVRNDVARRDQKRLAMLRGDFAADAPGRRELRLQEHAPNQSGYTQDI